MSLNPDTVLITTRHVLEVEGRPHRPAQAARGTVWWWRRGMAWR
ncbi:MAG: hypothetical protein ACYDHY_10435 [Acidiferrobacterales bacterium]